MSANFTKFAIAARCHFLSLMLVAALSPLYCFSDTLKLTSGLWPPYSGQKLKQQGASVAVVKAALQAVGHDLEVDFYPWDRTKKLASINTGQYQGYFPTYAFDSNEFIFSNPIGVSDIGLATKQVAPLVWLQLSDLTLYTLGVIEPLTSPNQPMTALFAADQPLIVAGSDAHNLQLLASNRIDGAVIDPWVMKYWLSQEPLTSVAKQLQMQPKVLISQDLLIAFSANEQGMMWRLRVNEGLSKIDPQAVMNSYLTKSY